MKNAANEGAAQFRAEMLKQQELWGLKDWTYQFHVKEAKPKQTWEAEVFYDCETRHVKITYFYGIEDALHPVEVARHETLHIAMADMILAAVKARSEGCAALGREEHKFIERALKVWNH